MQLPKEIDSFIFNQLQANYCPDFDKAKKTLNYDENLIKDYLGTYFPRSFVESYTIFDELFKQPIINNIISQKSRVHILDIGSGTGGELMGFLWLFKKRFQNKKISIVSFDGNKNALRYQKRIIDNFRISLHNEIILEQNESEYKSKDDFRNSTEHYLDTLNDSFDIILTSKFINEFFRDNGNYELNRGFYASLIKLMDKYISHDGIIVLSDITDSCRYGYKNIYFPKIMNLEIIPYMQNNVKTIQSRILLPLGCAFWFRNCKDYADCFQ